MLKALLNLFSILSLVCAGLVLALCVNQWLESAHNDIQNEGPSIVEIFQISGNNSKESNQERVSPFVSQAGEFALVINPPKPPVVKVEEQPEPKVTPPVFRAPRPSAKFKLLSTSYNRDRPEDSVALIDELGRDPHWVEKGDRPHASIVERLPF